MNKHDTLFFIVYFIKIIYDMSYNKFWVMLNYRNRTIKLINK